MKTFTVSYHVETGAERTEPTCRTVAAVSCLSAAVAVVEEVEGLVTWAAARFSGQYRARRVEMVLSFASGNRGIVRAEETPTPIRERLARRMMREVTP